MIERIHKWQLIKYSFISMPIFLSAHIGINFHSKLSLVRIISTKTKRDFIGRYSNHFYILLADSLHKRIPLKRFIFFRLRDEKSKFVMNLEVQLLLKQGQVSLRLRVFSNCFFVCWFVCLLALHSI